MYLLCVRKFNSTEVSYKQETSNMTGNCSILFLVSAAIVTRVYHIKDTTDIAHVRPRWKPQQLWHVQIWLEWAQSYNKSTFNTSVTLSVQWCSSIDIYMTNTWEEKKREAGALSGWNAATQKTGTFCLTSSDTFYNGSKRLKHRFKSSMKNCWPFSHLVFGSEPFQPVGLDPVALGAVSLLQRE